MKRTFTLLSVFALLAAACFGQQLPVPLPQPQESYVNGVFYAPNFGKWSIQLASSITASSTTSFTTAVGFATTPDGIVFSPFAVNEKIAIGTGAVQEIVTVSSLSNCNYTALAGNAGQVSAYPTCTVTLTGTTTNNHSPEEPITSADSGIMEAIGYAANATGNGQINNGTAGAEVYFQVDCGVTTLSTGGLTTTTTCYVPNQFFNQGSSSRVTTTITTSANWAVGIVNNTSTFSTANSTLTAGTTAYGNQGTPAVALVSGATTPNLTAVLYTMGTSNPGAGAIKSKVWGYVAVQSAF